MPKAAKTPRRPSAAALRDSVNLPKKIYVKLANGETLPLDVKPSDSIANLKAKIEEDKGIPKNYQRLTYQNGCSVTEPDDEKKIGDYKDIMTSTYAVLKLDGKIKRILVKTLGGGKIINLAINLTSTILEVKRKIFLQEKIPMEFIHVHLGDKTMQVLYDQEFLSDNQICKKILEYGLIMRIFGDVYIKTIAGEPEKLKIPLPKEMKINIEASDTFR